MALLIDYNLLERFENTIQGMIDFFLDILPELVFSLIILILTALIAKIVENRLSKYSGNLQKKMRIDATKFALLKHMSTSFVYLLGFVLIFYTIPGLKSLSATLLASVGILGLILGIAAQDSFGNLISGVALVFFQPFRVGDLITVGGNYGRVTDINLRQTTILTSDDRIIIIPNSTLNKETVINWTYDDAIIKWSFTIPISNDSDLDRAIQILIEEARKNPYVLSKEVLDLKKPGNSAAVRARVSGMDGRETTLLLDFWVNDRDNAYSAEYAIREGIKRRFIEEPSVNLPAIQIEVATYGKTPLNLQESQSAPAKNQTEAEKSEN